MQAFRNFLRSWLGNPLPGILLIGLLLRLAGILSRPIWYDEAFAVLFAATGPQGMLDGTLSPDAGGAAADIHPLGYYTLLWGWMNVFGQHLALLRLLSVLTGMASIVLAYLLAKTLFERKTALAAAFLVALSPFQIHYSQEIRMYSLLAFSLLGATLALWKGMQRAKGSLGWWILFACLAALAQTTHNLAVFYLAPLAASPILRRDWPAARAAIWAGLGAILLYSPWLVQLPRQLGKLQNAYWTVRPGIARLLTTLISFVTNLPLPGPWLALGLFVTLLVTALAAWQTWLAYRDRLAGYRRGLWLAYLAFTPPILLFLVSQIQPVFIERALLPSGIAYLIWVSWVLLRTPMPVWIHRSAAGLLLLGMAAGIWVHLDYQGFPYAPYAEMSDSLEKRLEPGDLVLHSNKLTYFPNYLYAPELPQRYLADPPGSGSDTLALPTQQVLGLFAYDSPQAAAGDAQRVWLVVFQRAIDEYADSGDHPHLRWLEASYRLEGAENWGELRLFLYAR